MRSNTSVLAVILVAGVVLAGCGGSSEPSTQPSSDSPPEDFGGLQAAYCEGPPETLPARCAVPLEALQADREAQVAVKAIYEALTFMSFDGRDLSSGVTDAQLMEASPLVDREELEAPELQIEVSGRRAFVSAASRVTGTSFSVEGNPAKPPKTTYDCEPRNVALCPEDGDWFAAAVGQ